MSRARADAVKTAPLPPSNRAELEALMQRHRGNRGAAARELGITTVALARQIDHFGLSAAVTELAVSSGVSGRRRKSEGEAARKHERDRILAALVEAPTPEGEGITDGVTRAMVLAKLGMKKRTLFAKLARHGITRAEVDQLRAK